ncbi:MAG: hypothetical protein QW835_03490 [Candidatus Hadarchaeum sp.]
MCADNYSLNQKEVSRRLIAWYKKHGRNFSFRRASDPYRVLVTEIMLRKTTAGQVERVHSVFFARFPDVNTLAKAKQKDVFKLVKPLGIHSRARDLIRIAKAVTRNHSGKIPDRFDELIKLPGVGEYIAGCVLTFSYNKPRPLLDSNVVRVLSRVCGVEEPWSARARARFQELYSQLAPPAQERMFHYAVIDLAARICKPHITLCASCPISALCAQSQTKFSLSTC